MAGSLDVILQGLRDAGSGIAQGTQNYQRGQQMQAEKDERVAKKEEADRILQERVQISEELGPLAEAAQADDFDHAAFVKASDPIRQKIVASGDDALLQSLRSIENVANERAKDARTTARATASAVKQEKKDAKDAAKADLDLQFKIQDRYDNDDVTKQTNTIRQSYGKLEKAFDSKPSAARDMGIVYHYMKLLDPPSVVRETEFKTAAEARSFFTREVVKDEDGNYTTKNGVPLPSFLVQAFQKADDSKGGSFLLPSQLEAFQTESENSYRAQLESQRSVDARTLEQIRKGGLDQKSIVNRTAEDDLKDLEEKAKKRAKKKDAAGTVQEKADDDGTPPAKVIGKAAADKIFELNKEKWAAAIAAAEGRQGRPFTPQERNTFIAQKMKAAGLLFDPSKP